MSPSRSRLVPTVVALSLGLVATLAIPALADEVVGKWEATVESPRGANDVVMDFKGSDEELQGSWTGRMGTVPLEKVQYSNGKLTFERLLEVQGRSMTLRYAATIDGDTMDVTMTTPRGERKFTAKRAE